MKNDNYHESVMVREVIEGLHLNNQDRPFDGGKYIDATLGTAGHALEIIKKGGSVLGIEQDPKMLEVAYTRLKDACPTMNQKVHGFFKLVQGNFRDIKMIAGKTGFVPANGILFDLGISNIHFKSDDRGFSFENPEAPLDMRLDEFSQSITAADLLNVLRQDQLYSLFEKVLNPKESKELSGEIVKKREELKIETVGDFLEIAESIDAKGKLHPATRAFLALRIAVNSELENLKDTLPNAFEILVRGGRLLVISFHSSEDAIVKNFFRQSDDSGGAKISEKPIHPSEEEVSINPRSRSARLRILEKL